MIDKDQGQTIAVHSAELKHLREEIVRVREEVCSAGDRHTEEISKMHQSLSDHTVRDDQIFREIGECTRRIELSLAKHKSGIEAKWAVVGGIALLVFNGVVTIGATLAATGWGK